MSTFDRLRTSIRLRSRRRYVQLRQRLSAPASAPAPNPANSALDDIPIVATGCHRSGTSLVRRILDSHPRIACPPETLFLEHLARVVSHADAEKGFGGVGLPLDQAYRDLGELGHRWLSDYARSKNKPRWAEKSPDVVLQLDGVDQLFAAQARFVLIVRDGMDVATSLGSGRWALLETWQRDEPDPYLAAANYWVDRCQRMLAFSQARPERSHLLSYDRMIDNPEGVLRPMFSFLGEAWDPAVLDFNRQPHDAGWEDATVSTTWTFLDNRGKHRKLDPALQARMWQIVAPTMRDLDYADRSYPG